MIAPEVFRFRLDQHCSQCEFWRGVCLKGHTLQGPMGCPLQKFPPVEGADYLPNLPTPRPPEGVEAPRPCCTGQDNPVPEMSWPEVFQHFTQSVQEWHAAGMPITPDDVYTERIDECKRCSDYLWFHCKICKCLIYSKAKLATEQCPKKKWRR